MRRFVSIRIPKLAPGVDNGQGGLGQRRCQELQAREYPFSLPTESECAADVAEDVDSLRNVIYDVVAGLGDAVALGGTACVGDRGALVRVWGANFFEGTISRTAGGTIAPSKW